MAMTTTPNPTAEQIVAEALEGTLLTHRRELDEAQRADVGRIAVSALRSHGLLSEGAPSEEQIERAYRAFCEARLGHAMTDEEHEALRSRLELTWIGPTIAAAGVAPQLVIDEAALDSPGRTGLSVEDLAELLRRIRHRYGLGNEVQRSALEAAERKLARWLKDVAK